MLNLKPLDKNVKEIEKYILSSPITFCDLSIGAKYMWRDYYSIEYAIVDDTLIMKESCPDYKDVFYFPIGKNISGAIEEIERYCQLNHIPLTFCCVDAPTRDFLTTLYPITKVESERDWYDYIYNAEQFKTYSGKKLSGQRNHVNKFKKLYPDYSFNIITEKDADKIKDFFKQMSIDSTGMLKTEFDYLDDFIDNLFNINQFGGYLQVNGKIIGVSLGEYVNDTLIVHVEKANTLYHGAYPMLACEFAKAFAINGIKYINREEDCGDEGLRTSKLQYHPLEIKEKCAVTAYTLFDKLQSPIKIYSDRLTIEDISQCDAEDYYNLYIDDELNKWWGYDYREDLNGETPSPEYFFNFQNNLKSIKEEYSFAVKENGKMVGELVLHNFTFRGGLEMGYRFFKACHGKGYATESALALKQFVIQTLNPKTLMTRCFKQNIPSKNLIGRIGFKLWYESDTHFFFKIDF